jgi:hypothetical protein
MRLQLLFDWLRFLIGDLSRINSQSELGQAVIYVMVLFLLCNTISLKIRKSASNIRPEQT